MSPETILYLTNLPFEKLQAALVEVVRLCAVFIILWETRR